MPPREFGSNADTEWTDKHYPLATLPKLPYPKVSCCIKMENSERRPHYIHIDEKIHRKQKRISTPTSKISTNNTQITSCLEDTPLCSVQYIHIIDEENSEKATTLDVYWVLVIENLVIEDSKMKCVRGRPPAALSPLPL